MEPEGGFYSSVNSYKLTVYLLGVFSMFELVFVVCPIVEGQS